MDKIRNLTIIITVITALASCTRHSALRTLLDRADTLTGTRPDSALMLLATINTSSDSLPEALRMRCELLKAKAQNKAYIPFTTDTTMKRVAEWYDTHGNRHERMMASYLLGCVYRDLNDAPTALEHYNKAVSLADTTANDCDWHTLCRIHGQMAELFGRMGSPIYELMEDSLSAVSAWKANDTLFALKAYELQVGAYYAMYNEDSVISITLKVVDEYKKISRNDLAAQAQTTLIYVYLNRKEYDKAKICMNYFELYSGLFDNDGNIKKGRELYYDAKAIYYLGIGKQDSAFVFLKKLQTVTDDIMCAEAANKGLMKFYTMQNNTDSVSKYSQLYCQINDSAVILRSAEEVNRTQALYNYNYAKQQMMKKTKEAERYIHIIIYIIIGTTFTIITICRLYIIRNQKQHNILADKNKEYTDLIHKHRLALEDLSKASKDFDKYQKDKEKEIKELRNSISAYQDDTANPEMVDMERNLKNSDIALQLHSLAAKGQDCTEKEIGIMMSLIKCSLPEFYKTISSNESKLNDREICICIMIRLCFIPSEMATLLNLSMQNITNIRSKINKKLFKTDGTKQLDIRIKRL